MQGLCVYLIIPPLGSLVSSSHLGATTTPEPTVNVDRLKVWTFLASFKVTQPSTRPDILQISCLEQIKHNVVLLLRLDTDGVHAVLSAGVTGFEPVYLCVSIPGRVSREKVPVTFVEKLFRTTAAFHWNTNKLVRTFPVTNETL